MEISLLTANHQILLPTHDCRLASDWHRSVWLIAVGARQHSHSWFRVPLPSKDRPFWLHNFGFQASCHISASLRLLFSSSLQTYPDFFLSDWSFLVHLWPSSQMAPQRYTDLDALPPVLIVPSLRLSWVKSRAAVLQLLPPYGISSRSPWSSGRRASVSVLPRPAVSGHFYKQLFWRLDRRSRPTYSSSMGSPGTSLWEAMNRLQRSFRPHSRDSSTPSGYHQEVALHIGVWTRFRPVSPRWHIITQS
jgi:hypothetical protein